MTPQLDPALFAQVTQDAPFGILLLDSKGKIVWFNKALQDFLGFETTHLIGSHKEKLFQGEMGCSFETEEVVFVPATETRMARWLQTWRTRVNIEPNAQGEVHYFIDISPQRQLERENRRMTEELERHASRDLITGLPNQQALMQGLEPLVSRSRRYENPLSVVKILIREPEKLDADHGHPTGERMLVAMSQLLRDQLRWADLVGRWDSDQFLIILPETPREAAASLAEKIHHRILELELNGADGRAFDTHACCGVTAWTKGDAPEQLLERAKLAVETAAASGIPVQVQ